MARKGILSTGSDTPAPRREAPAPRGAVGALQSSLTRLQENAVQELDPARIHDAGVADRLGSDLQADEALRTSLATYGQQVPVLVRPRAGHAGEYEIVYGRRRVQALRALGQPVKAMIRHLDDQALVLAQGQENTSRRDLSFIEKASFAAQLDALGYDRDTIAAALSIDMPMVSRMLQVGRAFSVDFLRHIGSAPGIGRERWLKLAKDMPAHQSRVTARLPELAGIESSDARFEAVLSWVTQAPDRKRPPPAQTRRIAGPGGMTARVKRSDSALVLSLPHGKTPDFTAWVDARAESLIHELYDRWTKERSED